MYSHNSSRKTSTPVLRSTRLLDQLREQIRYLHYSPRTEEAYVHWVKKFIHFHQMRHPRDMGQREIESFLTMMAVERKVSASTHRQALSALLFLYQRVFGVDLPWMDELARPVPKKRIPVSGCAASRRRRRRPQECAHIPNAGNVYCGPLF